MDRVMEHEEAAEPSVLRVRRAPAELSVEERADHVCSGHVPYNLHFMVHGAGHASQVEVAVMLTMMALEMPTPSRAIAIDYGYVTRRGDVLEGDHPSPVLVTRCSVTKRTTVGVLPMKGV